VDETLRRAGGAHYEGLVASVKRKISGHTGVTFRDLDPPLEDRNGRCGFVLSADHAGKPLCVEFFPHGDSSTPRLADQPFLIVSEWDCGAFFVEISPHYLQRYWNTDIAVTGYIDFREVEDSFLEHEEPEPHCRLSNDEMAERLLQTLI